MASRIEPDPQLLVSEILSRTVSAISESSSQLLAPLTTYDCKHGGDLVHTFSVLVNEGYNVSRAAKRLHLHRSGLLYRVARIQELLGLDVSVYHVRVALEIAILASRPDITMPE